MKANYIYLFVTLLVGLFCFTTLHGEDELFTDINAGLLVVQHSAVAWCDINNNGLLDVIISGSAPTRSTILYINNGDETFSNANAGLHGVDYSSVAWGDQNNNGFADLLLTGSTTLGVQYNITKLYRNSCDGTFVETSHGLPNLEMGSISWGDHNNDGQQDILASGRGPGIRITNIYENMGPDEYGNYTFSDIGAGLPGIFRGSAVWGDFNNSGYLDILMAGEDPTNTRLTRVYQNNGNGEFNQIDIPGLAQVNYASIAWGDFNNNGYLDFLLTGLIGTGNRATKLYRNLGNDPNGSHLGFEEVATDFSAVAYGSVAWGDYDNDGYLDILITGDSAAGRISHLYRNLGNDLEGEHLGFELVFTLEGVNHSSVAWGDYNNDGKLDILVTGWTGSTRVSKIYQNNTTSANQPPTTPTLSATSSGRWVEFHIVGSIDDTTPIEALRYNLRVGTVPGGFDIVSPLAEESGFLRVPELAKLKRNWHLTLEPGYYFAAVQAVDNGFMGSPFSEEISFSLIDPVSHPYNEEEFQPELSLSEIEITNRVYIVSEWAGEEIIIANAGLMLTLSGENFAGAEIKINPDLGFVPHQIAYRIKPSEIFQVVSNPGSWTASEVVFSLPPDLEEGDLEIVFPAETEEALPVELSTFMAILTADLHVKVLWTSESETNLLGYNIFRNEFEELSEAIRINPLIINSSNASNSTTYSYIDEYFEPNIRYYYWLEAIDLDLSVNYYGPVSVMTEEVADYFEPYQPPLLTRLAGAYPNPFNPGTNISFSLSEERLVSIHIYNNRGQLIRTLIEESYFDKGHHSLYWDGRDYRGRECASGIYFCRMRTDEEFEETVKILMLK